jgi:hypothetical protein
MGVIALGITIVEQILLVHPGAVLIKFPKWAGSVLTWG